MDYKAFFDRYPMIEVITPIENQAGFSRVRTVTINTDDLFEAIKARMMDEVYGNRLQEPFDVDLNVTNSMGDVE